MKTILLTCSIFILHAALAEELISFANLPELEKDKIVWNLHEKHDWGRAEQKPICRDILANQGYSFANATNWTCDAVDLAEAQGWKDLASLITAIYERPKDIGLYERAFRYLRAQNGQPVPKNLIAAAQTLTAAGSAQGTVAEDRFTSASDLMRTEPDQEALLVYALQVACSPAGRGDTERGRKAAIEILKTLPSDIVSRRLRQLRRDCRSYMTSDIEWTGRNLGISLD